MPFAPHYEATLTWTSASLTCQSKLFYMNAGGAPDLDTMPQVADFINAKVQTSLRGAIPPYVTLQPIVLRFLGNGVDLEDTSTEPGAAGLFDDTITGPGIENDVLPEGDQIVIQMRTGLAGRSKRGRVFLPFIPEECVDNSGLNALGLPLYKAIASKFKQSIDMDGLGVLTPVRRDYKNTLLVPVTHARVVSEVCTRRDRRAPKRPVYFKAP